MSVEAVMFDFDGTIVDSFKATYETFKAYFRVLGRPFMGEEEFRRRFTSDWKDFINKLGGGPEVRLKETEVSRVKYEDALGRSRFIPGVREAFIGLEERGFRLAVVSTSIEEAIRKRLAAGGIEVEVVVSGYDIGVTDKERLLKIGVERLGVAPPSCVYVGDMKEDVLAGREMGMWTIALATGFHSRGELEEAGADVVLEDGFGLVEAVSRLGGGGFVRSV